MDDPRTLTGIVVIMAMGATHMLFPWFDRRAVAYRHLWVHFSGGIAVGYVTLYLLPKMTDFTLTVIRTEGPQWEILQYRLYLAFLAGLLGYLILERTQYRQSRGAVVLPWIQGFALGTYNVLMGYFIFGFQRAGVFPYVLAGLVLCVHFVGVDHQIRERNRRAFDDYLRWIMTFCVLLGAVIAYVDNMPEQFVFTGSAFLGGAMLVNVMSEELPSPDSGSMKPFLTGVALFVVVMAVVRSTPYA
ncbi:MAG: hypothetical protein E2O58_06595 [Gammaproteobacteria bacterium]|nr:MAG: hypothetical protein E2O58_06595 [Gammaproteobacteria bacterium]